MIVAAVLATVAVVVLVAFLVAREPLCPPLQERWGLTDDELARYVRELPEVLHGIKTALPPGTHSRRQIAELAEQSTLRGVLLKRVPRPEPDDGPP